MRAKVSGLGAMLIMIIITASSSAAPTDTTSSINPIGRPAKPGKGFHVQIWYDAGSWHLRAEGGEGKHVHVTKGIVTVQGGTIVGGGTVGTEDAHAASGGKTKRQMRKENKAEQKDDDFAVHSDHRGFDFILHTSAQSDGVDFTVSKGTKTVTFTIQVDGDDSPKSVEIGASAAHPDSAKVVLPAEPDASE